MGGTGISFNYEKQFGDIEKTESGLVTSVIFCTEIFRTNFMFFTTHRMNIA